MAIKLVYPHTLVSCHKVVDGALSVQSIPIRSQFNLFTVILAQCINAFSNIIHMLHVRNLKPEALVATFKHLYYLYYKY